MRYKYDIHTIVEMITYIMVLSVWYIRSLSLESCTDKLLLYVRNLFQNSKESMKDVVLS